MSESILKNTRAIKEVSEVVFENRVSALRNAGYHLNQMGVRLIKEGRPNNPNREYEYVWYWWAILTKHSLHKKGKK